MSNNVLLPSLSGKGWCSSPKDMADAMMSHFVISKHSQTYFYGAYVASFQYLLQENSENITSLCVAVQRALNNYFGFYFQSVDFTCEQYTGTGYVENDSKQAIAIYGTFQDTDGNSYNLANVLYYSDGAYNGIMKILSGEDQS